MTSVTDLDVRVVSLDDLMRMKGAGGRIEDKMQLHVLAVLKRTIEEVEQDPSA